MLLLTVSNRLESILGQLVTQLHQVTWLSLRLHVCTAMPPNFRETETVARPRSGWQLFLVAQLIAHRWMFWFDSVPTADPGHIIHGSYGLFEPVYTFWQYAASESLCKLAWSCEGWANHHLCFVITVEEQQIVYLIKFTFISKFTY